MRLVSPLPVPGDGDYDDYGDGGHKNADHGVEMISFFLSFFLQIIRNPQNTIGCVGSKSAISSFPGSCFEASTSLFARLF